MVIEALVRGEVMTTARVPDEDLQLDGAPWERAAEYREEVIRLHLLKLDDKLNSFLKPDVRVEYRLVFQSKLHLIDETGTDTTDSNGGLRTDPGTTTRDPEDARSGYGGP